jgi:glycosyltransferase involved in cell wall biosynthesis
MTSEAFHRKIHTIFLGIDPEYGIDRVQRSAQTSRLILSVGRLVEKKGFDYLLKSLVLLKARGLFPRCVLIGDGPEKGKLQAMVKDCDLGDFVTFTGALPNGKVLEYLGSENILVAPSVYAGDGERDGIPTVLIEALICEMAVVSTRISGIPELIEDQWNGILVPARDERAIADAIQKLLENPGLRKEYGLRGREKVRAEFNVYKSSRKLRSLIDQSCTGPAPGCHGAMSGKV